jgi:hypothetical protein
MLYVPYICIAIVICIIFVLWAFWGGGNYEFVGLAPLDPETCSAYTGSMYTWGNRDDLVTMNDTIINAPSSPVVNNNIEHAQDPDICIDNTPSINEIYIPPEVPDIICINDTEQNINIVTEPVEEIIISGTEAIKNVVKPVVCYNPKFTRKKRGRFISRGERICKETMERIYGVLFENIRPKWLVNPETKRCLELDCYNPELKIAVEYNGEQHYKWPNFTNQSYDQFINQVRRDALKVEMCDRYGVYLITVPYNVPFTKIPEFITSYLPETIRKRLDDEDVLSTINV